VIANPAAKASEFNGATGALRMGATGMPGDASRPMAVGGYGPTARERVASAPSPSVSPAGASEKVGGFPVPAAPFNAEEPASGRDDENNARLSEDTAATASDRNWAATKRGRKSVTAGETAPHSEISAGRSLGRDDAASDPTRECGSGTSSVAWLLPSLGVSSLDWGRLRLRGGAAPFSGGNPIMPADAAARSRRPAAAIPSPES